MSYINKKAKALEQGAIRAMFDKAVGMENVISMGIGEPDMATPTLVCEACKEALDLGMTHYTPNAGTMMLRKAIAEKSYISKLNYDPKTEIIITNGGMGALSLLFLVILEEGDEILIQDPQWLNYVAQVRYCGGTPVRVPTDAEHNFEMQPEVIESLITPKTKAIMINTPNNPTGMTATKTQLQSWVDYANKIGAVILFDAAYEAYITEPDVPHSIYECEGARTCAIEIRSFSKNAGFTGLRLGFTVVPKDLKAEDGTALHTLWARRHGTKFNGAPYIVQRAGEAVYSPEGQDAIRKQVAYYMNNARVIREGLQEAGYTVYGGVNAPYIWLKTPDGLSSWEFFDRLLETVQIVGTPGSGFGPSGEGYFRLTGFGTYENTVAAIERIKKL